MNGSIIYQTGSAIGQLWLNLAMQAKDAGTVFPLFTGGETFLYPHVRELYQAMVHMGMEVSINSNGSSISEETVVALSQQKPDDVIRVGLDLDELDITAAESKATYGEIKAYVKEQTGLSVSSLYIAQIKQK